MAITFSLGFEILITLALIILYFVIKDGLDSPQVAKVPILIALIFAYINVEGAKDFALIYIIIIVVAMLIGMLETGAPVEKNSTIIAGKKITGSGFNFLNYGLGFMMLIVMFGIQTATSGLLIGVPLSANGFGIPGSVAAGIAENLLFVTILLPIVFVLKPVWQWIIDKFSKIPLLGIFFTIISGLLILVVPLLLVSYLFGIFHITAYGGRVASIAFAMSVMAMWIISYKITGSSTPMDVSHVGWNFIINVSTAGGLAFGNT